MNNNVADVLSEFISLVGVCPSGCKRESARHCDCWTYSRVGTQAPDVCCFCGLENHAKLYQDKPELLVARNLASLKGKKLQKIEPEPLRLVKRRERKNT